MLEFEQLAYSVEDYQCYELYPFATKNKRYFRAKRQQDNHHVRIIIYPLQLVDAQSLIQHLNSLQNIQHPLLGKILQIKEKTVLVQEGSNISKQDVIAVIIEDQLNIQFYHFYDTLLRVGPLSQQLSKTFLYKLLQFVKFMQEKGINNGFHYQDLYIDNNQYQLRIDNYGDRRYFKVNNKVIIGDLWELAAILFTFFNQYPPYSQPSSNDKFFLQLKNHTYDKFWEKNKRKNNTPQNVQQLLNTMFHQEATIRKIQESQWMKNTQYLTDQKIIQYMENLCFTRKIHQQLLEERKQAAIEKYQQAIRNRYLINRGDQEGYVSLFLEKLKQQENNPRKIRQINSIIGLEALIQTSQQNSNIIFAHIISILQSHNNHILAFRQFHDYRDYLTVILEGYADEELQINVEARIEVIRSKQKWFIKVNCLSGSLLEQIWVSNYFKKLLFPI